MTWLAASDDGGGAGPLAAIIIVLLAVVTILLIRNMSRRLKRLPRSFDEPPPRDPDQPPV